MSDSPLEFSCSADDSTSPPPDLKSVYSKGAGCFQRLRANYGIRFLILLSLCSHWTKGFCRVQILFSLRYFFQEWNISGPQLEVFASVVEIPWAMKPLIAVCSDLFPVLGLRKTPYMLSTSVVGLAGLCLASFVRSDAVPAEVPLAGLFFANIGWMTCNLLVDGISAQRIAAQPESGPDLIVFQSIGQQITFFVSMVISGVVIDRMQGIGGLSGAQWNISLCILPSALLLYPIFENYIGEARMQKIERKWTCLVTASILVGSGSVGFAIACFLMKDLVVQVVVTSTIVGGVTFLCTRLEDFQKGRIVAFLAFVSLFTNLSVSGPAHYFFTDSKTQYPDGPHFEPWFWLSICGFSGAIAGLLALLGLSRKAGECNYRFLFTVLLILGAAVSSSESLIFARITARWGIPDHAFVVVGTILSGAVGAMLSLPTSLLLSRLCPYEESMMFSILSSAVNLAQLLGGPVSALLCVAFKVTPDGGPYDESSKFENLWICNLVTSVLKVVPLVFIFMVPNITLKDPLGTPTN